MKRKYLSCMLVLITSYLSCAHATPHTLTLDNQHTYVIWNINHLGFSTQAGKWYASGKLVIDEDNLDQSKLNVTINMNDLVTGLPELDKHLKSAAFFDTNKYPIATFASNKVTMVGKHSADVVGVLTLHGVSKSLTLHVILNKVGKSPIANRNTAGFSAKAELKRSDFGLKSYLPNLGDKVSLQIGAEAYDAMK
ncbi:MAG: YceI family protein [bacterium]|nr:YceI family protein [bacterium]